jgi:hypothetical protein
MMTTSAVTGSEFAVYGGSHGTLELAVYPGDTTGKFKFRVWNPLTQEYVGTDKPVPSNPRIGPNPSHSDGLPEYTLVEAKVRAEVAAEMAAGPSSHPTTWIVTPWVEWV